MAAYARTSQRLASADSPLDALAREWPHLARSRYLRAHFCSWQRSDPVLVRLASPLAAIEFMRGPAALAEKDAVLCALLRCAKEEPSAGQIVLEAIRPGLLNLTARITRNARNREELRATLLLAIWDGIRRYPLERRPRRVAANLLLDALHRTLVEADRESTSRSLWSFTPLESCERLAPEQIDSDVDGMLDRAVRAGALSPTEAEIILASRIDGVMLAELSSAAGVSYNTMKVRRQRAERRLLLFLGFRPVPRGQQKRPSSFARVAGAGSQDSVG
jgi:DNA-directed RNA polymerase specialized sigma24 family protein